MKTFNDDVDFGRRGPSMHAHIDRAAFPVMDYWAPEVGVTGIHELLGNALVMDGETERTLDLRGEELPENSSSSGATFRGITVIP